MTDIFDVAIIGAGPAGLSAAVTARARNKKTVVFESAQGGEKLRKAPEVNNYLGLPGMSGKELMDRFKAHMAAAAPAMVSKRVLAVYPGSPFTIMAEDEVFQAKTVIVATGINHAAVLPGERELLGRGVSYCATCDGKFFQNKIVVVGVWTEQAEEEVSFLAELAAKVYIYTAPGKRFAGMPDNVEVIQGARLAAITGDTKVQGLLLQGPENQLREIACDGVFLLRQADPPENLISDIELEEQAIKVNRHMETNIPGLFAAGDVTGQPFQIAKAAGEGVVAALQAVAWLSRNEA